MCMFQRWNVKVRWSIIRGFLISNVHLQPYPVEKIVHYPVKEIVKVPVHVPKPYPVEKIKHVPVTVHVDNPVPVKVYVPQPYPVEKIVKYPVKVPVPGKWPTYYSKNSQENSLRILWIFHYEKETKSTSNFKLFKSLQPHIQ